ncbi:Outer membrane lipoprotein LolB precursor [Candidatus Burkholderia pumila]|uniref:Outer-membrane lipoprotein LolB n=1 Tax=Candidatus Burkholderia pumila TaxID=1090375 RepID=A0ABR5HLZ2_9BURK|nr:Outer membrane lipoprotein LolB precursor [Candidatus Burkholderia pumila]
MAFDFFAGACASSLRRGALGFAAVSAIILSGCAVQQPTTKNASNSLSAQTSRAYHGRFAVQYSDQNGTPRNAYGNFDWQETGDTVTLQLRNPLGSTMAIVTSSPSLAMLELPNRQPVNAKNVSDLMQNTLGFALPVEGLRYWLQSSAAPNSRAQTELDLTSNNGRPKEIRQDGWTIDYVAYADAPATGVKRVNLSRNEPPLDIKLVLDQ